MRTDFWTTDERGPQGPGGGWVLPQDDAEVGGITAEYAIAILTAAGFAGLLLAILQSDTVRAWLLAIVERALG
ncbi:MAG: DUF4244 domain-containing protein [Bifidobacteriaceae bacterium]|jgi:hypothetical protein|nr:DUF4244 domain-containing protein [Bifidobacteriaceae bacterium]